MDDELLKLEDAARMIGRYVKTVRRWYAWLEGGDRSNIPVLPPPLIRKGPRGVLCIYKTDIPQLALFREYISVNRGLFRDYYVLSKEAKMKREYTQAMKIFRNLNL